MTYKNPCATADVIVETNRQVLLIKRKKEPFKNIWALPGGHLECGKETLEQAACRELREETGILVKEINLQLLGVYSEPNRDPRGHYITHVYVAESSQGKLKAGDDASETRFFPLNNLPKLAFDHNKILEDYLSYKR